MATLPLTAVFWHSLGFEENQNYVQGEADTLSEEMLALQIMEEEWFETKKSEKRNVRKFADWQKKENKFEV